MITQELASEIWQCHREIAVGNKLIEDMEEAQKDCEKRGDKYAGKVKDSYGRERSLMLGVPSGENCHRILELAPSLAKTIITAHIANKKADLVALNERAKIEIAAPV